MSLALLFEGAVRGLLLGLCIHAVLRVARLRQPRQRWSIWVLTLVAALVMVASMRLLPVPVTLEIGEDVFRALPHDAVERVAHRDLFDLAVIAYSTVAAGLFLRLVIGLVLSMRLLRGARKLAPNVRSSARIATPVTIGRTILVPADFAAWPEAKQRAVLAHEQAHVCCSDFYVLLLANLHCALLWFSPFAWWLRAELRDLAEQASDEAAISALGDKHLYAEILFDVARTARPAPHMAVAMARSAAVEHRVDLVLQHEPRPRSRLSVFLLAAFILIAAAITSVAPQAQVDLPRLNRVPNTGQNPFYPERAQSENVEGYAEFRIAIDADGKPTQIELTKEDPPGYGFAEASRRALETWTFQNDDHQPRTGRYRITLKLR